MKILFASTLLFFCKLSIACCVGNWVSVEPYSHRIASNPVFLISFSERSFQFQNQDRLENFEFYAVNKKGSKVKLTIEKIYFSGTQGQLLLKAEENLTTGDSISLAVEILNQVEKDSDLVRNFIAQIEHKRWTVSSMVDKQSPRFTSEPITTRVKDYRGSSVGGYDFIFKIPVSDNSLAALNDTLYQTKYTAVFFEISFNNQTFITSVYNSEGGLSSNMCGSNSNYRADTPYEAIISLIDYSGNRSEPKKISFTINIAEE